MVSGAGTSLQNLIDRISDGRIVDVEIAVVISSRADVAAVERTRRAGLPCEVVRVRDHVDVEAFSTAVVLTLERYGVELAVQAGWLCYWRLPRRWLGRAINVHPALLPKFGGQGMYGHHVHEAVLAAREPQSGATVHVVDNEYDHGEILLQRTCAVRPDDSPVSLAGRVQAIERELLPEAIEIMRRRLAGGSS